MSKEELGDWADKMRTVIVDTELSNIKGTSTFKREVHQVKEKFIELLPEGKEFETAAIIYFRMWAGNLFKTETEKKFLAILIGLPW